MPSPTTVLLRTQSDERLVALARGGHDRAFEAIVERYRRQLLRACRRILPEARAEDALQQALLAAWTGLQRGDDVVELRPWLFRIVRNTALNQLRVSGYDLDELVDTLSAADDPEDEVVRRAVVRQTLASVAALPDRQREALLRTAIEGEAQADVARDLGLTSTAMRQLVHRARVAVRATATALVPMPVATWLASAGGATATATLAKAGTVAVLAGGAVTAPALIHHDLSPARQRAEASADAPRERARTTPPPTPAAAEPVVAPVATTAPVVATRDESDTEDRGRRQEEHGSRDHRRSRHDRGSRGEDDDHGDDGHRRGDDSGGDDDEHSGPGSRRGGDDSSDRDDVSGHGDESGGDDDESDDNDSSGDDGLSRSDDGEEYSGSGASFGGDDTPSGDDESPAGGDEERDAYGHSGDGSDDD